jgi:hypothetical protein
MSFYVSRLMAGKADFNRTLQSSVLRRYLFDMYAKTGCKYLSTRRNLGINIFL